MTPAEVTKVLRQYNEWRRLEDDALVYSEVEIGLAIDAAVEMIDRLEAAEKSDAESLAMYRKARDERDALRAKIAEMEKQEPYSYIYEYANPIDGSPVWRDVPGYWNAQYPRSSKPLYALPGAQGENK